MFSTFLHVIIIRQKTSPFLLINLVVVLVIACRYADLFFLHRFGEVPGGFKLKLSNHVWQFGSPATNCLLIFFSVCLPNMISIDLYRKEFQQIQRPPKQFRKFICCIEQSRLVKLSNYDSKRSKSKRIAINSIRLIFVMTSMETSSVNIVRN